MSKFLDHKLLSKEIINLFEEAESEITIVSPYIKLHPDIKKALRKKQQDPDFFIEVLYGKNEGDLSKSLSEEDLAFLRNFKMFIFITKKIYMPSTMPMKAKVSSLQ